MLPQNKKISNGGNWQMEDRIRLLENRMTTVETKVDDIREDIKEIKDTQKQNMFWLITTLSSTLITLGVLLFTR